MKGKLASNELIADFDYSAINEDYSFFRVETSDKYISGGANFLDLDDLSFTNATVVSYPRPLKSSRKREVMTEAFAKSMWICSEKTR